MAVFDKDVRKIGKRWEDVEIQDIHDLESTIASAKVNLAIVSVPASVAQEVVDKLTNAGVRGILNCAPMKVTVSEGVQLQNVDLSIELERICYLLNTADGMDRRGRVHTQGN